MSNVIEIGIAGGIGLAGQAQSGHVGAERLRGSERARARWIHRAMTNAEWGRFGAVVDGECGPVVGV